MNENEIKNIRKPEEEDYKKKKSAIFLLLIAILILILSITVVATGLVYVYHEKEKNKNNNRNDDTTKKEIEINTEGMVDFDDEQLEFNDIDLSGLGDNSNINFFVYSNQIVSQDDVINLVNPVNNDSDIYFKFRITKGASYMYEQDGKISGIIDEGEEIFKTADDELFAPGKAKPWKPSDFLEKGKTDITIFVTVANKYGDTFGSTWYPVNIDYK